MKIDEIIAGPRAPLYHGTDVINLANIIRENTLDEGAYWERAGEPHGVRFTRDVRMAWTFGESEVDRPTVLVFDQTRLAQRYRIVPYQDVNAVGGQWESNEMEEVVVAPKIPVSPYLIAILVNPAHIQEVRAKDWAEYAMVERGFKSVRSYYAALDKLSRHPLIRSARSL